MFEFTVQFWDLKWDYDGPREAEVKVLIPRDTVDNIYVGLNCELDSIVIEEAYYKLCEQHEDVAEWGHAEKCSEILHYEEIECDVDSQSEDHGGLSVWTEEDLTRDYNENPDD